MSDPDAPAEVDLVVGARVRAARLARGLSQGALGEQLGVSFQQIQKYENGANRISASRLVQIADALRVSPQSFLAGLGGFDDLRGDEPPGIIELQRAYQRLPPSLQAAVLQLARSLLVGTPPADPAGQREERPPSERSPPGG